MKTNIASHALINKAVAFAVKAHSAQCRKGTDIPYVTHPLSAGMILARAGASENMVIAGILHDCLEDTAVTFDELKDEFNEEVATLVLGCSEKDKKDTWRNRKTHTIEHLKSAPDSVCIVSCADKLHNLLSLIDDFKKHGDGLWKRFNASKQDQVWYYSSLGEVFKRKQVSHPIFRDFDDALAVFVGLVKD